MKTLEMKIETDKLKSNPEKQIKSRTLITPLIMLFLIIISTEVTFAHCDTMDGPVIKDAKIAIEKNNINYVLKWVQPQNEDELKNAFILTMKVRRLSSDAMILADKYFYETLVRLHRSGEGVPYTGVKPSGTPVDDKILAADKSIDIGNLSPLKDKVSKEMLPELTERFEKVIALRDFDVNNIKAGREYIEAYVKFFKFAEGEEEGHSGIQGESVTNSVHLH